MITAEASPQGGEEEEDNKNSSCDPGCDGCDSCGGCDLPGCDLGLFATLLVLGAWLAQRLGPADRRAPHGGHRRAPRLAGSGAPRPADTVHPGHPEHRHRSAWDRAGLTAIRGYRRWLSGKLPGHCRYIPHCSAYGLSAVDRYGLAVGGRLAADRVRRCRPEVPCGTPDPLR